MCSRVGPLLYAPLAALCCIILLGQLSVVMPASMYSRIDDNHFRIDLIPVSSTVIPMIRRVYSDSSIGSPVYPVSGYERSSGDLPQDLKRQRMLQDQISENDKKLHQRWVNK